MVDGTGAGVMLPAPAPAQSLTGARELVLQMSQEEYDRFRRQQYVRQKQREFRGQPGRYQRWLERYNNPALVTRRRCAPGYLC
jgi:hypothetical protein